MKSLVNLACALISGRAKKPSNILAIVDENTAQDEILTLGQLPNIHVLSNRYDIFLQCQALEIPVTFSDADFTCVEPGFDLCLYRISKERAFTHHVFNQVARYMVSGGTFIITGQKSEGVKTYHKALVKQLGFVGELNKNKQMYNASLSKKSAVGEGRELDDKHYASLRKLSVGAIDFISKPGLYGWSKVDQGSALLMDCLASRLVQGDISQPIHTALDLGCGYGYLSMQLRKLKHEGYLEGLTEITATDNNAGAIRAAQANLCAAEYPLAGLTIKVVANDCGLSLKGDFDLIVCNPPFHKGFDSSRGLSEKFLAHTARLLAKSGCAYVVVNGFIPIEKLAREYFNEIQDVHRNSQFKVFCLSQAVRGR